MEVRSYALLPTRTTACNKPSERSIIEFPMQITTRATTSLLLSQHDTNTSAFSVSWTPDWLR